MRRPETKNLLIEIYQTLLDALGPQHWWPGETTFEVMVGAILTQNTSWKNVERSIQNLKSKGLLTVEGIGGLKKRELTSLIRSSGYFRIKAERLRSFVDFISRDFEGDLKKMSDIPLGELREKLLRVHGIGPETADSILLYGLKKPVFVIDAYTRRVLCRHGVVSEKATYDEMQGLFMGNLPHDEGLFNEYHALIVRLGKSICKTHPLCGQCPLKRIEHRAKRIVKNID